MTAPLDIARILDRAGADADAPEGSQAWALAQVVKAIEADAKDAARYRWLRDKANNVASEAPAVLIVDRKCAPAFDNAGYGHRSLRVGPSLDQVIDAVLAKQP